MCVASVPVGADWDREQAGSLQEQEAFSCLTADYQLALGNLAALGAAEL